MITRRTLLSALGLAPLAQAQAQVTNNPCPIQILIDAGPTLEVVVPNILKKDITNIISSFLADASGRTAREGVAKVISTVKDVTLTLTTRCFKPGGAK